VARAFVAEARGAADPKVLKPSSCRAAPKRCVRSRAETEPRAWTARVRQEPTNAEASDAAEVGASPKPTTPTRQPTHNTGIKPTREAGSA